MGLLRHGNVHGKPVGAEFWADDGTLPIDASW